MTKFLAARAITEGRRPAPREFLTARRRLTVAELRSIGTNPIEVVPAPGPGRVVIPLACIAKGDGGVTYTGALLYTRYGDDSNTGPVFVGADTVTGFDRPFIYTLYPNSQVEVVADTPIILTTADGEDPTDGDYPIDLLIEYEIVEL